jgi:hypothetical protein
MARRLVKAAGLVALVAALTAPVASGFRYDPPGQFTTPGTARTASSGDHQVNCKNGVASAIAHYYGNPCSRRGG